jgi:phospholipid/cholesterol/gamma-HCH transport system substrate-binding protein
MSTKARVGIFTLLALAGVFAAYYFITNFALTHNGYEIGIRFHNVGGLQEGSTVLLSGVTVGEVTSIDLLPDQTVEVTCTINNGIVVYRDSIFVVAITITGATTLTIEPPMLRQAALILPQQPLPVDQQPWGTLPPTLTDLLSAGQEQLKNFSKTMAVVNRELPALARKFSSVATHTDELIQDADVSLSTLTGQMQTTVAELNDTIRTTGGNMDELTGNLNGLVSEDRPRIQLLVDRLSSTANNLNKTMAGIASIADDPLLHDSLIGTVQNVEGATAKLKAMATELESVTGDPKTQSELKATVANLASASAKADAILGSFATAQTQGEPASPGSPLPLPSGATPPPSSGAPPRPHFQLGGLLTNLVQADVRETWGTHGGGPASDLNLELLPRAKTHVTFGANDLGYSTTYNFLLDRDSKDLQLGAGVEYSKLGIAALFRPFGSPIGIDARVYDPKHPTLDLYGDLRLSERLQLFYGERYLWTNTQTKTPSFGLEVKY